MDLAIQHYKENGGAEELQLQQSLAMRTEWEPCLAHHPPLQSFGCDAELAERGGGPPPPPPPSKRRFRSPTSRNKPSDSAMCATMDDRHGKMRETLMERQVIFTTFFFLFLGFFLVEMISPCVDLRLFSLFHPTLRALRALLADVVGRINNVTRALGALLLPPIKNVIPMPAFLAIGPDTPRRFQVNYAPSNPRRVGRQVGMYNKRCIPRLL